MIGVTNSLQRQHFPMRRHIAQPFDAGGLHGGVRVQPLGDGVGDDGVAFLFQQFDQPSLLRYQRIDLGRLAVEKGGDLASARRAVESDTEYSLAIPDLGRSRKSPPAMLRDVLASSSLATQIGMDLDTSVPGMIAAIDWSQESGWLSCHHAFVRPCPASAMTSAPTRNPLRAAA